MGPRLDLVGIRFGRLVPIEIDHVGNEAFWLCACECGASVVVCAGNLRSGSTKSCGCLRREIMRKHGHASRGNESRTYRSWAMMIGRTTNPNGKRWADYGGRGIAVCDRWRRFENFLADMGERPVGRTLDRINNDGNYEPGNCRWATPLEQTHNRRVSLTPIMVAEIRDLFAAGYSQRTLSRRLKVSQHTISKALRQL